MKDSPVPNNTLLEEATATIPDVEGNLASCENNPTALVRASRVVHKIDHHYK